VPQKERPQVAGETRAPVPAGFWGFSVPGSQQCDRISYTGFPSAVTAGKALASYLRDYLDATWHEEDDSRVHEILWLEANVDPNATTATKCNGSLGIDVAIHYHFQDPRKPGIALEPAGVVHGTECYGGVAADTENAATADAFVKLKAMLRK
jgi:hypothetical protein